MRRTLMTVAAAAGAIGVFTATALAVSATMGNDAIDRGNVDTFQNFTVVDTNSPAQFDGYFTEIDYYAHRAGTIRFLVVDSTNTVTWVSDEITAAAKGAYTVPFAEPVGVTTGSNLGVYSKLAGVVSWEHDATAERAAWEPNRSGLPAVGETLSIAPASDSSARRYYSMNANVRASSPEICKDGGWETYGYRNQGQCIASVVANENAGKE